MPSFPIIGKPDPNPLEQFFEPTVVVEEQKRAARLAESVKARQRRSEIKQINQRKSLKDRSKKG